MTDTEDGPLDAESYSALEILIGLLPEEGTAVSRKRLVEIADIVEAAAAVVGSEDPPTRPADWTNVDKDLLRRLKGKLQAFGWTTQIAHPEVLDAKLPPSSVTEAVSGGRNTAAG